jgi:SulP family sulfate permease
LNKPNKVNEQPRQSAVRRHVPITVWLPGYQRSWLRPDVIAGLTLWGILVPEAIAYAGMAGAPVKAGLYALLLSLPIFAILGTTRQLVCAATSSTSIMLAAVVAPVVANQPDKYVAALAALVITIGVIFLIAGISRLGFIASFMSGPVMTGFVFGLAIYIAVHQLPKIFGISKGSGDTVQQFWHVIVNLGQTNWVTLLIGAAAIGLLFLLHRVSPRVPAGLVVLILGILVVTVLDLATKQGVAIVGHVSPGLPSIVLPEVSTAQFIDLLPGAFGIALVALAESLGAARTFAEKHDYEIDVNQEMIAFGAANVGAGLLGGLSVAGSMSSSTVNDQSGARSQLSPLVAFAMVLVTVLVLMPMFKNLPEAVLGAIVIHAVIHLMNVGEMRRIYRLSRREFIPAMAALLGVVVLDILPGLIIAVALSLIMLVFKASRPAGYVLGQAPGKPGVYSAIVRHPENETLEGLVVFRVDGQVFFANATLLRDRLAELLSGEPRPRALLLDLRSSVDLDVSSLDMLKKFAEDTVGSGVELMFCEVIAVVRDAMEQAGILQITGAGSVYPGISAGVEHFLQTGTETSGADPAP